MAGLSTTYNITEDNMNTTMPAPEDLEIGQRVQVIYQWGQLTGFIVGKSGTEWQPELGNKFLAVGEYVGRDEYNIIVQEPNRRNMIPIGCIRAPGWIRILEDAPN